MAYHKLCSCLDVIGDTELAFRAYEAMSDEPAPGSSYILVYGFLQALVLQQDAVRNLYAALGLPSEGDCRLKEIREVRNDAVGHPTKRHDDKSFSHISRPSVSKAGFDLMTFEPNQRPSNLRYVSLKSLRDTQRVQLEKALYALLQALRQEEMEHRQRFRHEKLVELFPDSPDYQLESLGEAVRRSRWEDGARQVAMIRGVVEQFKVALERRRIAGAYPGIEHLIERLEDPSARLAEYFSERGRGRLSANDAETVAAGLRNGMSELKEMAGELDAEYAGIP